MPDTSCVPFQVFLASSPLIQLLPVQCVCWPVSHRSTLTVSPSVPLTSCLVWSFFHAFREGTPLETRSILVSVRVQSESRTIRGFIDIYICFKDLTSHNCGCRLGRLSLEGLSVVSSCQWYCFIVVFLPHLAVSATKARSSSCF